MKQLTLSLIVLVTSVCVNAQQKIPQFGKVDKSELEMNSCDFDKDAEAVVLFDEGEFFFSEMFGNERHVRIKILKNKGLERANVHIKYYSYHGIENVRSISAQTYNLDAAGNIVVTKLEKKSIYDKKINARYSEVAFSLPDVKVGSVIEYKYLVDGSDDMTWYFQESIPVLLSRYTINFPGEIEMSVIPHCILPYKSGTERKSGRDVQIYTMEKVPALRDEAYISCEYDYLQSVTARIVATNFFGVPRKSYVRYWPQIIRLLMEDEDFGVQLKRNIPRTKDLDSMLAKITSPYEKMTTIHNYVRKSMEWDKNDNIWALSGVKSAWKDKKGTSGEINLILVNLLKDAGLKAHPVLVSTRDNGRVNTFYAAVSQFNKVMAYVEIDDKNYLLDAVEKYTPSKLIPLDVVASQGLVIEKIETEEWGWKTLWDDNAVYYNSVYINGEVDKNGQIKGTATVSSDGYARVKKMPLLKEDKKAFIEKFYTSQNTGLKVDSVNFENEKIDSLPLTQKIAFTQDLNGSGEYQYFTANIFSGLEKNPFTDDNRFSDIFFGYKQKISIVGNISIPENYQFEELPKNLRMIMPDTSISFTRLASVGDGLLSFRFSLEFQRPIYGVEEYPEFKEFYKKLFDLLNEQFVIRKKN